MRWSDECFKLLLKALERMHNLRHIQFAWGIPCSSTSPCEPDWQESSRQVLLRVLSKPQLEVLDLRADLSPLADDLRQGGFAMAAMESLTKLSLLVPPRSSASSEVACLLLDKLTVLRGGLRKVSRSADVLLYKVHSWIAS